ncbi:NETI motif-containing protein [Priestia megaterium]|nr:NETI motif-containing protein [Priestia megaterium]
MLAKKKKAMYELQEDETIIECLDRMKKDGYTPVRRIEKPVFEEKKINGKIEYVPVRQQIVFEGKSL